MKRTEAELIKFIRGLHISYDLFGGSSVWEKIPDAEMALQLLEYLGVAEGSYPFGYPPIMHLLADQCLIALIHFGQQMEGEELSRLFNRIDKWYE